MPRELPNIEVKSVADANSRSAFANVTSATFDVPWTVCREVYGSERAWLGSFRGYIGCINGIAVTTTAVVIAGGIAGIYSVGTLPAYRGRGYAEALMRRVLQEVEGATGIRRTALQSTRSGYSLYTRRDTARYELHGVHDGLRLISRAATLFCIMIL